MNYTIYEHSTGQISFVVTEQSMIQNRPYIPGNWNANIYYIKDRKAKPYPPTPGNPDNYQWDLATETWILDPVRAAANQRRIRDRLLAQVDRVNPIWYASLTAEQQTQLQDYRSALLAVPQQPGFPGEVSWPQRPAWL